MTDGAPAGCSYELDGDLRIRSVDAAWFAFAAANDAPELVAPPGPVGQSIFVCMQDATTKELYRLLFKHVSQTGRTIAFPLRCDSPSLRRFLEMEIRPSGHAGLQLRTRVLRLEERAPVTLLDRAAPRGAELVRMCGWCKAVDVEGRWHDVSDGVVALRVFEADTIPAITHGICPPCYARAIALLE